MKNLFKKAVLLSIAMFVFGCSKDGETGPAGPAGANGINGTNGTNGTNGNANVFGSTTFTTSAANWTSNGGGVYWTAVFTGANEITQDIVDRGIVSVFLLSGSAWTPLPLTVFNQNTTYGVGVGTIEFVVSGTDFNPIPNPSNVTIRYVVISPSNRLSHPNTDWNNYEEVKQVLKLKD
jgi:hypothetical protein